MCQSALKKIEVEVKEVNMVNLDIKDIPDEGCVRISRSRDTLTISNIQCSQEFI